MRGLIHIYEGDGKGKTTAGIGLVIRCVGRGNKVMYTQFLKSNQSGELGILEEIKGIHLVRCEKNFGFTFNMTEEVKGEAREYYTEHFKKVIQLAREEEIRLLVLDELIATYNSNLIDRDSVIEFLKNKPEEMEVVLTGRNPAEELVELADYVSRITKVKHPYDKGINAREGIEY